LIKKQDDANLSYRKVIICLKTGEDPYSGVDIYSWESLLDTSLGPYVS